ncbi:MAG: HEAT repeat domain-containing protein [Sedimentisphaerales bacterium]|nr:HEAT repeat domain-containing protein [Sedimentisphaerales bacterium]
MKAVSIRVSKINTLSRKIAAYKPGLFILCLFFVIGCGYTQRSALSGSERVAIDKLVPQAIRIIQDGLSDSDAQIRVKAIEVVAATENSNLMPKLERLLTDSAIPVRFGAAVAIGDMRYVLARHSIKKLLSDPDESTRIAAAYALARFGASEYLNLIRQALKSKDQTAAANAVFLAGRSSDKDSLGILIELMKDVKTDDKVKFIAAESRAALGDETIFPKLWAILLSTYTDDRVLGIRAMGLLGTEQARNALVTMLSDDVLEVRLAAAEQLGTLGYTTGVPEVLDVFTKDMTSGLDKQSRQRIYISTAMAIGQIDADSLLKFLPGLLHDSSQSVRIAAAKAVIQCSKRN